MIGDTCIMYSLSKNITTQKLKGKLIEGALDSMSIFLKNCTNTNLNEPRSILLTAYSAWDENDDPDIGKRFISEIQFLFGDGKTEPLSYSYPSGEPSLQTKTEWVLKKRELDKVVNYLINEQPLPKYTLGPIELMITYDLNFINPISRKVLVNQESNNSFISVWLSRSNSCSPTFYFPFSEVNDSFNEYINNIEPFLPFKFERKHLRIVKANKDRTKFTYKKID